MCPATLPCVPRPTVWVPSKFLSTRTGAFTREQLEWIETGRNDVLRFRRPNGWQVIMNFGEEPFPLDGGRVLLASRAQEPGSVAGETTVWLAPDDDDRLG